MNFDARKIRLIMHLRKSGIVDTNVLSAIERVPREVFVPEEFSDKTWEDVALPIGYGQTISQPLVVALMTQALEIHPQHKVLEVGTGSGYQAAVLSCLCRRLYTIERIKSLLKMAEQRFVKMRVHNITAICGDGMKGWPAQAPFDRIIATAAGGEEPPPALLEQMAIGGVMVMPLSMDALTQRIVRFRRTETGFSREDLWPVRFVPLLPNVANEGEGP
ncbi:MAG TPA: protein-L-isoaspartate O-methyltransferase [Rhodospirillaceae bacterium]|nr:MAG: protein-L-isoaspartate O-methyltransferase [Alphaproteobacteria bacterium GWF2_58_20]HAU29354.1 protein-L-isoaspartate O-methyltransferase [Rhodospirillaceae bacterium]